MNPSMHTKLEQLARRLEEIDRELASGDAARDMNRFRALGRERSEIEPVVTRFHEYNRACADLAGAQEMLADPDMKTLAEEEIHAASGRMESLEADLQRLLLPKDPNDDRNIFLEIRAGTGGDESALFAGALLRMYMRYAERHRWTTEMISESASELGGYKEVIVRIVGAGAYSKLKFESGGHRVQRVPETEAQGRIHTSACSFACCSRVCWSLIRAARIFIARSRFLCWDRSSWHSTTIPVGRCVMRTALSVLLTCWPPAPEAR